MKHKVNTLLKLFFPLQKSGVQWFDPIFSFFQITVGSPSFQELIKIQLSTHSFGKSESR
jgi:hypothetical protein